MSEKGIYLFIPARVPETICLKCISGIIFLPKEQCADRTVIKTRGR